MLTRLRRLIFVFTILYNTYSLKRHIHFYQAFSRIGLINPPNYSTTPNIGVEEGPRAILTSKFLNHFTYQVDQFTFTNPEDIPSKTFNQTLAKEIQDFRHLINHQLKRSQTQVVLGGDHSVTLSSVLAVMDRLKSDDQLLYLQFDSHGDCNLTRDSVSDNFHGMYLRPVFAQDFDIPEIKRVANHLIPSSNIIYIGNLDLDGGESEFFARKAIKNFTSSDLVSPQTIIGYISSVPNIHHIHISFDIDSLDQTIAPSTGIPAAHGLNLTQLQPILEFLARYPSISLDLVEYNPRLPGADITLKTIHHILNTLLQA